MFQLQEVQRLKAENQQLQLEIQRLQAENQAAKNKETEEVGRKRNRLNRLMLRHGKAWPLSCMLSFWSNVQR